MIHDVRLQIEELRMLSKFQWVASFTVTQCHMHCRGFTILSAAYLFSLKKQPGSHQLIFCEKWPQHEQHQIQWSTFVWITWYIGPIERLACEIFSLTLDFMSSCPIMNSNIFLGIRACSGSASASLLKETGEFSNQRGSIESFAWVLPFFMMIIITISFGDWRFKAVFWWEICRIGTLWNAAGHDPKGHGYRRHHQNWPLISSDGTAAAEEWCFFVQSSRNQKADKWSLPLNQVETCSRSLRSTSHADNACVFIYRNGEIPFKIGLVWTTRWRNWCRTNLGLETAPIKNFVSKTRFVSLGSYCALPSIAGKLADWSYTSWS